MHTQHTTHITGTGAVQWGVEMTLDGAQCAEVEMTRVAAQCAAAFDARIRHDRHRITHNVCRQTSHNTRITHIAGTGAVQWGVESTDDPGWCAVRCHV